MAEYIDKSAVIAKIDEFVEINKAHGFPVDIFDMEVLKKRIEQIPAADVAPVVHGSLKHTGTLWSSMWVCTNCNEIAYYPPHGNRKKRIIQPCGYNYCPNCGAKMDEEAVK